jgi:hypothetical protein
MNQTLTLTSDSTDDGTVPITTTTPLTSPIFVTPTPNPGWSTTTGTTVQWGKH